MRTFNNFKFLFIVLFLSGCAFATYQAPINYTYSGVSENLLPNIEVNVGSFEDGRNVNRPNMIVNLKNAHGQATTGGYVAEKPIAEIIKDAVIQAIKSRGIKIKSDSPKIIEGELLDLSYETIMGFWSGKLTMKLVTKISVKDSLTGNVVWRDTYIANEETKCTFGGIAIVQKLFTATLDDFTAQIASDDLFLRHIK